ncbi:MAG TPA: helix-turn-helix transcriptional regulator [Chitinispirillaceae bacterium]|nr:helix-turn-helix transcriptional regulator [Chitinispirillaceae bacterium]
MLAVVKMPHTKRAAFKVIGKIDAETIKYLNKRFGESNVDFDEEIIDVGESEWFTNISKKIKPGAIVRTYRENCLLTQQQLAEKVGISKASHISDIENGRRQISKTLVKKFAEVFGIAPEMLL